MTFTQFIRSGTSPCRDRCSFVSDSAAHSDPWTRYGGEFTERQRRSVRESEPQRCSATCCSSASKVRAASSRAHSTFSFRRLNGFSALKTSAPPAQCILKGDTILSYALTGKQFQIGTATLVIDSKDGKRIAVTIPARAIVKVVSRPLQNDRLIDVSWDGRVVQMFAVDLDARGTEAS
jgi:hypothetical protein